MSNQSSPSAAAPPSDELGAMTLDTNDAGASLPPPQDESSSSSDATIKTNVRAPTGGPSLPRPSMPASTESSPAATAAPDASLSPQPSSTVSATPPPQGPSQGGGPPQRASGGPPSGSASGGGPTATAPMNAQQRAKQMAGTRLPPSLQAKLAANAARSSSQSPSTSSQSPSFLNSNQRIDPSSLLARGGLGGPPPPSMGPGAFPPSTRPGMNGLAARRAGAFPAGQPPTLDRGLSAPNGGSPGGPGMAARRPRPGLRLSDMGISATPAAQVQSAGGAGGAGGAGTQDSGAANRSLGGARAQPPGRLAAAPAGGLMSSAFSDFSDVIDPSGRLNFAGKAILHASGVEFGNGTSFKINMEDLELKDVLGKGNYGEVRKVRHTKTGVEMAMKEIRLELDASKLNAIIMELDILHRAISPEIVEFYGAFFVESCVFYCMEFMDAGSLENLYDGACSVPEDVLARIVKKMVKGLAFLKDELQIMHRDVKPTNVLVNTKGEVKLCDFGVSGQLEKSLAKTNIGCQSYMAPERIKGESLSMPSTYTVASDVWSLGLSIVETTLGVYPYPPETYSNVFAQLQAIVHGDPPQLPAEAYSDVARDFVSGCLEKVPARRFTYSQMLQHPWLIADDERGAEGVDMQGWVQGAMKRRKERREEKRAAEAAVQAGGTGGPSSGAQ